MNYLIFDTEQTYNYGYIITNEKGEILLRENLILTNYFEDRKLIGENTYKRKKPIYEKDPYARFVGSAEGANIIAQRFKEYNIQQIISHNISEDRRQLELLAKLTGISFPDIPFYDSINLVKVLFPNNTQTGLEAIVSDITGIDVKQTHTALQDCELLFTLISPIIEYIPYFIKYQEIFAHDSDYEVTQLIFLNLNTILPLPKNIKDIHAMFNADTGLKKKINNFFINVANNYGFWEVNECVEYGAKGNALKTPGKEVCAKNMEDALAIHALFKTLDKVSDTIVSVCVQYQASQETDEVILEKIKIYETEYTAKENALNLRAKQLEEEYSVKMKKLQTEYAAKENALNHRVATLIMAKIKPIVEGGLFNKASKTVKNLVAANDTQGLYNYFNN